jgi:antibiotic biosynthesis monooxygenase (ABM) superfamily enzyme
MIKHIVLFDFKDENREDNIEKAKEMLLALIESVPTLQKMEVGINFSKEARAMDLSIYTEFENMEGLNAYANHPEHLKVVEFIKTVVNSSKVSDYMV